MSKKIKLFDPSVGIKEQKLTQQVLKSHFWASGAGIGLVQLKKLNVMNRIRRKIAKQYSKEINLDEKMPYNENCSYHLYWIMVKNRKKFMEKMNNAGIETGIRWRPVHTMSLYK